MRSHTWALLVQALPGVLSIRPSEKDQPAKERSSHIAFAASGAMALDRRGGGPSRAPPRRASALLHARESVRHGHGAEAPAPESGPDDDQSPGPEPGPSPGPDPDDVPGPSPSPELPSPTSEGPGPSPTAPSPEPAPSPTQPLAVGAAPPPLAKKAGDSRQQGQADNEVSDLKMFFIGIGISTAIVLIAGGILWKCYLSEESQETGSSAQASKAADAAADSDNAGNAADAAADAAVPADGGEPETAGGDGGEPETAGGGDGAVI